MCMVRHRTEARTSRALPVRWRTHTRTDAYATALARYFVRIVRTGHFAEDKTYFSR